MSSVRSSVATMIMHRAEALALVALTRNRFVTPIRADVGDLDFLALVQGKEEFAELRVFGVVVKATTKLGSLASANRYGARYNADHKITSTKYLFPTIALLFSMEDEKGYFAWVTEPEIEKRSTVPKLKQHDSLQFHEFDGPALDLIADSVSYWYTVATKTLSVQAPGLPVTVGILKG